MDRILLAHSLAMSTGGVPLVYLGDEVGQLNDPHWRQEPGHGDDARWVHRPRRREADHERRHDLFSVQGRIFGGIRGMIAVRRSTPEFEGTTLIPFDAHNSHVLGYQRPGEHSLVLCLANVSDWSQFVTGETLSGFLPRPRCCTRSPRWTCAAGSSWRPTGSGGSGSSRCAEPPPAGV